MCIIVDVNIAQQVLLEPGDSNFAPVRKALQSKKARLVIGGKLRDEYLKVGTLRAHLMTLDRQGSARILPNRPVHAETQKVEKEAKCCSNDAHIIGLARVSGVRLLCTNDNDLEQDFCANDVITPTGNIFKYATHGHLIRKHCSGLKA
jgi:predicted nucleic acid-binding protein